jgi:hypothetical protein
MWCVVLYDGNGDDLDADDGWHSAVRATFGPFPSGRCAKKFAKKWNDDPDYDGGPLCFTARRLVMLPEITKSGLVGVE